MGCAASSSALAGDDKELQQYVSPDDIRIVQESWSLVQHDMAMLGLGIFKRLFAQNKDLKKLFYHKLQCPGMTLENVEHLNFDDQKMMTHGMVVMETLGAAVECLHNSEQLTVLLIGIGERHVMYGVSREMVPRLWPAVTAIFEDYLGDQYSSRVEEAWERVFGYIGSKVMEGIDRWSKGNTNTSP
ncbi:hypothetical protein DPMN_090036 [Dreissena polymorpha]|uniref:Globin domain-containing protein n=1 Tax=Dreissena polymorpha TaxID=45954 RepID=A0A9D4KXH9_DREPO|nr:hypothetical protein DPMN_090036 [Dreissena polymorpha]